MVMRDQSDEAVMVNGLIEENCHQLGQLEQLLQSLGPQQYQKHSGVRAQHSIGKHVRHIIDHYAAFLGSLCISAGELDYEARERDPALESDPERARVRLRELAHELRTQNGASHADSMAMICREEEGELATPTSVGRELAFLSSHTIHHMAILGLLVEAEGLELPEAFGVHSSTLRYWRRQQEQTEAAS